MEEQFVGRERQIAELDRLMPRPSTERSARPGRAVLVRGRRRVGKSRLVEQFIDRAGVPSVYFTASTRPVAEELAMFVADVAASDLPGASTFAGVTVDSWDTALRLLATALPADRPSVVVLDELPYLTAADPALEGTLQKVFDRELSRLPVLLIGIGSDLAMMEALNTYGRPFHQRATEMVVPPLSPREVGDLIGLPAADAFDAALVTGGLPLVCREWERGATLWEHLTEALDHPTSPLLVSGERALAAEFPSDTQARRVLEAVGSGETTFTRIGRRAGGIPNTSLTRSLEILTDKRVVAAERPLSTARSRETRYRVADPYLRFWLTFLGPALPEIERGRGDRVLARIRTSWLAWRGRAIEPLVREAIDRLPPEAIGLGDAPAPVVGGYWTRTNDPEIDLVLADRAPVAERVLGVGSVKWHDHAPFDQTDLVTLASHRAQLPGADDSTPMIAVSRTGATTTGLTVLTPEDLLAAW